jgi:hypothetical protein
MSVCLHILVHRRHEYAVYYATSSAVQVAVAIVHASCPAAPASVPGVVYLALFGAANLTSGRGACMEQQSFRAVHVSLCSTPAAGPLVTVPLVEYWGL